MGDRLRMYRKKVFFIVELAVLVSTLLLSTAPITPPSVVGTVPGYIEPLTNATYGRTVMFYDFFDWGPGWKDYPDRLHEIWEARYAVPPHEYKIISGDTVAGQPAFPVYYIWYWKGDVNEAWYYSSARCKAEVNSTASFFIDDPLFLPYNLTGGLEPGVSGGHAGIDWYMMFPSLARCDALGVPPGNYDGWLVEWNGTITLDEPAAKKILGLSASEWTSYKSNPSTFKSEVETLYADWLDYQGNTEYDIYCFYWYPLTFYVFDITLQYDSGNDYAVIDISSISWGMDTLFARWFGACDLLRDSEYWYSDLNFEATIGPSHSDAYADFTWDFFLYQWGEGDCVTTNDNFPSTGGFGYEPMWGDDGTAVGHPSHYTDFRYRTYWQTAPDEGVKDEKFEDGTDCPELYPWRYGDWVPFDYSPSDADLLANENLIFNFSNVYENYMAGDHLWAYTQLTFDPPSTYPNDTIRKDYGYLMPGYPAPWPETLAGGKFSFDNATKTETFTGPLNFTEWSMSYENQSWYGRHTTYGWHPETYTNWDTKTGPGANAWDGTVRPWGCPYIQFRVVRGPGEVTGDGTVDIFDLFKVAIHYGAGAGSIPNPADWTNAGFTWPAYPTPPLRSDPDYDPQADIEDSTGAYVPYGDGLIDIYDLFAVAAHYGESYPLP